MSSAHSSMNLEKQMMLDNSMTRRGDPYISMQRRAGGSTVRSLSPRRRHCSNSCSSYECHSTLFLYDALVCTRGMILLCKYTHYLNQYLLSTYWMSGTLLVLRYSSWEKDKILCPHRACIWRAGVRKTHTLVTNMTN